MKTTGVLLSGMLITSTTLSACARDPRQAGLGVLDAGDQALMEEIADTLLPTTASSPGAKAAGVGPVINLLLTDCRDPADQKRVVDGLKQFRDTVGDHFASMSQANRENWLRRIDAEAKAAGASHYFPLMRDLSLQAYFSSEVGTTKALRYIMTPGKWVGCVPLQPGQPAWA
ncbi:MAG TPA: gluconate 2-dehydrogenase subunit 3 family protein [Gemmatimonadaceae bacterium]|nr:gluconate 2-dehydrogenase subunit 3 family protein [Gemmatimonadaceae bacterium]